MNCLVCDSLNVMNIFRACDIHGRKIIDSGNYFEVYKCINCEGIFIPSVIIDKEYYSGNYSTGYYDTKLNSRLINIIINSLEKFTVKIKEKLIVNNLSEKKEKVKIFDIGCGNGQFLNYISSKHFDKYGLEINLEGFNICKEKGINVFNQDLDKVCFDSNFFDVITLWHVIEHSDNPNKMLISIKKILKDDGILLITTPDTNSLGFKYGQSLWFHLDAPRHLTLHNKVSLSYLLEKNGFEIIQRSNFFCDFPLDLFWSVRKSRMKYLIYPLYPFFKFFDRETILFICRKGNLNSFKQ